MGKLDERPGNQSQAATVTMDMDMDTSCKDRFVLIPIPNNVERERANGNLRSGVLFFTEGAKRY